MASAKPLSISHSRIIYTGRIFFAVGILGIGIQHFIFSEFIPVMIPWWPANMTHTVGVYFIGSILILGSLLIIFNKQGWIASSLLGILFFLSVITLHVPKNLIENLISPGAWTNALKELALAGSAFVVAGTLMQRNQFVKANYSVLERITGKIVPVAKFFPAFMLVFFGIDHFLYASFVATLVPSWIPWHLFWTYFAGVALIAGGLGLILNIKARLAANMLGIMLFIWLIILHIPRAFADPAGGYGNEWTSVFEALAFSGIAFILGQTLSADQ